ncbi:MFS general substrate transporter [Basidiobolus meristosporus CBS 931.73]|uniref:MFS general substrate transporter n=1 Tax=Basidiobolus meristosporus CBS 931.73 TaxID=1314790 RepID=A0A1Y1YX17_9FUNG|nr:MFS general substrate transporter [Basidiobolus meristosporus CBS 931.73]|eukprot:ORY02237.1 MFS general substrate transporter [Basidiobolus meristosporus CBS 931.73]
MDTVTKRTSIRVESVSENRRELERKLRRKFDLRIIPFVSLLYLCAFIDRTNIGNARLDNIEEDLNIDGSQYSWALSIFFFGYVIFEVPSNLMLKKWKASRWIARIMVTWGGVTIAMAGVKSYAGLLATRFFLGVAEAGLFPGIVFYLTFWYTRDEQCTRVALFFASASLAGAFGGVLAFFISQISGTGGLRGWQWIFILEGIPTVIIGIVVWFYLPDDPESSSWLSESEKELAESRLRYDSAVTVESDHGFDRGQFLATVLNAKTWLYMFMYIGINTPVYSLALLLPTIIRGLGFTHLIAQLLTAPPYILAFIFSIGYAIHSDHTKERCVHLVCSGCMGILGFVLLAILDDLKGRYIAACITVMGTFACVPVLLSWVTNNSVGSTKSATASGMVIAFGNCGGAISGQFYRGDEAPQYLRSHMINVSFLTMAVILALIIRTLFKRENHKFDRDQSHGIIVDEIAENPTFRFTL